MGKRQNYFEKKCISFKSISFSVGILIACSSSVIATSTGLNNIPTADIPPDRTIVFQGFTNIGDERPVDYVAGFKMGLKPWGQNLEWGLDGRWGEGEGMPPVFQFKYAAQPWEKLPTLVVGVTNVAYRSKDREEVGQSFSFALLSHDFGWFRAHGGYGFQHNNDAGFFGFDKTFKVFDRDFMLRSDFIQIEDQEQWLGSLGFIYFLHEHFALESWASQPFEHGEPFFMLKLNSDIYVLKYTERYDLAYS